MNWAIATDVYEARETLATGICSTAGIKQQVVSDNCTTHTVRAYIPASGTKHFMRLKVTGP